MRSGKCLFSRGLILSDLKRFWWVGVLYGLVLFFVLPLRHLMLNIGGEEQWRQEWLGQILRGTLRFNTGDADIQLILILTVPVLLAVLLLRYLHSVRATAAVHALPLDRKSLLVNHAAAGFLLLAVPVLATGFILAVVRSAASLQEYYPLSSILHWIGITLLFACLFFASAVFAGMLTGNSLAQAVFTYIMNILPFGVYALVDFNLSQLFYGYIGHNVDALWVDVLPMLTITDLNMNEFGPGQIAAYVLAAALLLLAAGYVYEKRPLEAAGDIIAFPFLRPVFKYGVTVCSMLLGGAYFSEVYDNLIWGYLLGSLLGYCIAQILLEKSFRIGHTYKGYLISIAVIVVLLVPVSFDAFGYIRRVPAADQVEKVYFGQNYSEWQYFTEKAAPGAYHDYYSDVYFFRSADNIQNIINLQRRLTEKPYHKEGKSRYIIYSLKDGTYLSRRYYVDEDYFAPELQPIYESLEYKRARFPVLTQKSTEIKTLTLFNEKSDSQPVVLAGRQEIQGFTAALRQDILKLTFRQMLEKSGSSGVYLSDDRDEKIYYAIRDCYSSVRQWLREKDLGAY
ncbi:MAG: DUF6449 domain-containing protein [Peptococcaceae bacterium]